MDFYGYPSKIPRTIDRLCILDCIEIIVNDLGRYGVPERLAMEMIDKYFMPFSAVRLEHLLVLAGQFSLKLCQTP